MLQFNCLRLLSRTYSNLTVLETRDHVTDASVGPAAPTAAPSRESQARTTPTPTAKRGRKLGLVLNVIACMQPQRFAASNGMRQASAKGSGTAPTGSQVQEDECDTERLLGRHDAPPSCTPRTHASTSACQALAARCARSSPHRSPSIPSEAKAQVWTSLFLTLSHPCELWRLWHCAPPGVVGAGGRPSRQGGPRSWQAAPPLRGQAVSSSRG